MSEGDNFQWEHRYFACYLQREGGRKERRRMLIFMEIINVMIQQASQSCIYLGRCRSSVKGSKSSLLEWQETGWWLERLHELLSREDEIFSWSAFVVNNRRSGLRGELRVECGAALDNLLMEVVDDYRTTDILEHIWRINSFLTDAWRHEHCRQRAAQFEVFNSGNLRRTSVSEVVCLAVAQSQN